MSLLKTIIKVAAPLPKIEDYSTYLFVGPHPDDIEVGAGATAAKLAAMGKHVTYIICTDGRYGDGHTILRGDELVEERKKESIISAEKTGVKDIRFLNFCDGNFYDYNELRQELYKQIGEIRPDVVFCPDPDVISECHPDHKNAGNICKEIAFFAPYENIMEKRGSKACDIKAIAMYMSAKCNQYVKTDGYREKQLSALFSSHNTQFPENSEDMKNIKTYITLRSKLFGIKNLCADAEGFRVLGQTQMHCLPEMGE